MNQVYEANPCRAEIELGTFQNTYFCLGQPVRVKGNKGLKCPFCGQVQWATKTKTAVQVWNSKNRKVK